MRHDKGTVLFTNGDTPVTYGDIVSALERLGANRCDVLFVHSDISFGKIDRGIKRKELLLFLWDALQEMGVQTLMFPTFTFSFCNREDYDVQFSPTAMGMLPEYIRKQENVYRSNDPILSVAIVGNTKGFEKMTGTSSCGEGGIFHQIHTSGKKVKFLFLGTSVMKCFTFLHYVEEVKQVPYRYIREFTGNVIRDGRAEKKTVQLYVRYKGVTATLPGDFDKQLLERGIMRTENVGASSISLVDEKKSFEYISEMLDENKYIFSILPEDGNLLKEYEYGNVVTM